MQKDSLDVVGVLLGNFVSWLLFFTFTLMLCGMCMGMIRNIIKMATGKADEEVEEPAKTKFKPKREPGRAVEANTVQAPATAPVLASTAEALEAFDPAELEEADDVPVRPQAPVAARVASTSDERSDLTDRLATEFDAQVVA